MSLRNRFTVLLALAIGLLDVRESQAAPFASFVVPANFSGDIELQGFFLPGTGVRMFTGPGGWIAFGNQGPTIWILGDYVNGSHQNPASYPSADGTGILVIHVAKSSPTQSNMRINVEVAQSTPMPVFRKYGNGQNVPQLKLVAHEFEQ